MRIGGMVKNGSIQSSKNEIKFIVTDFQNENQDSWIGQHKHIEEEFPNSKFIFVGKDMDYGEFENLLNK